MDWADVARKAAEVGLPLLGAALPIPGGAALGGVLAHFLSGGQSVSPESVIAALGDPTQLEKAREFEVANRTTILQITTAAETAQIQAVNATMQAEAGSANWPTWTWRPFIGFMFGLMTGGVYFIMPMFHIVPPAIPQEVFMAYMAILGVASWGHSKALADPNNNAVTRG